MVLSEVVEKPPSSPNHDEQTPSGMEILGVLLQVLGEFANAFRKKSNLHFRRASVRTVDLELVDDFFLPFFRQSQLRSTSSLSSLRHSKSSLSQRHRYCKPSGHWAVHLLLTVSVLPGRMIARPHFKGG